MTYLETQLGPQNLTMEQRETERISLTRDFVIINPLPPAIFNRGREKV